MHLVTLLANVMSGPRNRTKYLDRVTVPDVNSGLKQSRGPKLQQDVLEITNLPTFFYF
jgi:hypothetical protein